MIARKLLALALMAGGALAASPSWVGIDKSGSRFVLSASGERFTPWGFNYSRDEKFRLLEDCWDSDWAKVERNFREMKTLGANVVRIHLQFAKFMDAPGRSNQANLARLEKLIGLAEQLGLYLDVTGLGTYRVEDVPAWYRNASEKEHWAAQAEFWEAIARVCANRPGVFAYNVMNEPMATSARQPAGGWTHPAALQGLQYVEYIDLNPAGRKPSESPAHGCIK